MKKLCDSNSDKLSLRDRLVLWRENHPVLIKRLGIAYKVLFWIFLGFLFLLLVLSFIGACSASKGDSARLTASAAPMDSDPFSGITGTYYEDWYDVFEGEGLVAPTGNISVSTLTVSSSTNDTGLYSVTAMALQNATAFVNISSAVGFSYSVRGWYLNFVDGLPSDARIIILASPRGDLRSAIQWDSSIVGSAVSFSSAQLTSGSFTFGPMTWPGSRAGFTPPNSISEPYWQEFYGSLPFASEYTYFYLMISSPTQFSYTISAYTYKSGSVTGSANSMLRGSTLTGLFMSNYYRATGGQYTQDDLDQAYANGYSEGYEQGYNEGYRVGYQVGLSAGGSNPDDGSLYLPAGYTSSATISAPPPPLSMTRTILSSSSDTDSNYYHVWRLLSSYSTSLSGSLSLWLYSNSSATPDNLAFSDMYQVRSLTVSYFDSLSQTFLDIPNGVHAFQFTFNAVNLDDNPVGQIVSSMYITFTSDLFSKPSFTIYRGYGYYSPVPVNLSGLSLNGSPFTSENAVDFSYLFYSLGWINTNGNFMDGYNMGYDAGYSAGYTVGHFNGYNQGHNVGYNEGLSAELNYNWLLSTVDKFLNFQFFGTFSISTLLLIVLGGGLILVFLKFFAGG